MNFTEESFYKATYKKIYELLKARNEYINKTGDTSRDTDNDENALRQLDNFLG